MLRLRPSVVSLTPSDVTEVIHRRRFQRFVDCEADDQCLAPTTPDETRAIRNTARSKAASCWTVNHEATSTKHNGSPLAYGSVRPLVANLLVLLTSRKETDTDTPRALDVTGRQGGHSDTGVGQHQGSSWSPQLCLRPKRNPAMTTTTNDANFEAGGPAVSQDSLARAAWEQSAPLSSSPTWLPESLPPRPTERGPARPAATHRATGSIERLDAGLKDNPGPSTPRCRSSSQSSGSRSTVAVFSARASPEPFEDSNLSRALEAGPRSHSDADTAQLTSDTGDCQLERSSPATTPKSPGRLRIYNDLLPASFQPQMPQNLPEARHQSRLRGSYTAPARPTSPQLIRTPTATARSRHGFGRRRELSPLGLQTPGFKGLYGGMENADDAAMAEEIGEELARRWTGTRRPSSPT